MQYTLLHSTVKCSTLVWCLTLVLSRYATTLPSDETTFFSSRLAIISTNFLSSLPWHNVELSRISNNDDIELWSTLDGTVSSALQQ